MINFLQNIFLSTNRDDFLLKWSGPLIHIRIALNVSSGYYEFLKLKLLDFQVPLGSKGRELCSPNLTYHVSSNMSFFPSVLILKHKQEKSFL